MRLEERFNPLNQVYVFNLTEQEFDLFKFTLVLIP